MTKLCNTCEYLKFCARSGIEDVGCDRYKRDTTTNEEWLHTLNTEEKALFLARLYGHSRKIDLPELLFRNVGTREVTDVAEYIGKWLKEKHKE